MRMFSVLLVAVAAAASDVVVRDGATVFHPGSSAVVDWSLDSRGSSGDFIGLVAHNTFRNSTCGPFLASPLLQDGAADALSGQITMTLPTTAGVYNIFLFVERPVARSKWLLL